MYTIVSPNVVYDSINNMRLELSLYKGKQKIDIAKYLDDISIWMDANRDSFTDKYLPFCILSVGMNPIQVSAFMYGLFAGKGFEKHGLKLKIDSTKVDKDTIIKEMEACEKQYKGLLGFDKTDKFKERKDDRSQ